MRIHHLNCASFCPWGGALFDGRSIGLTGELVGDPRVIPVMTGYFAYQLRELPPRPLRDWGRFQWQNELVSVAWLYNRTGEERLL